jgi:uncharacterized protein YxjI
LLLAIGVYPAQQEACACNKYAIALIQAHFHAHLDVRKYQNRGKAGVTMRFHVKERAWSLTEAFVVRDDAGSAVFEIHGKFFHIGDDLVMRDHNTHQELVHIKQHIISLLPSYELYRNGQRWANVHEQFRLFGERFKVKGDGNMVFHVDGDIWRWNFTISDGQGNLMGEVSRQLSLFRDSYAVNVAQGVDAPFVIALAIVLELVKEHHEKKREGD